MGKYIREQHGAENECYDFETAMKKCEESLDCHGIATQNNVCAGRYRVTHGAQAFLIEYSDWRQWNLWAYTYTRSYTVKSTWSGRLNGMYIKEGHGNGNECYDFQTAINKCEAAIDCHGIATQSNVCGGKYRVSHGAGAALLYYGCVFFVFFLFCLLSLSLSLSLSLALSLVTVYQKWRCC